MVAPHSGEGQRPPCDFRSAVVQCPGKNWAKDFRYETVSYRNSLRWVA